MIELRRAPRPNINWRCGLRLSEDRILLARAVNISTQGLQILCSEHLQAGQHYALLVEVPPIHDQGELILVNCQALLRQSVLADELYRCQLHLQNLSGLHQELWSAWVSKAASACAASGTSSGS